MAQTIMTAQGPLYIPGLYGISNMKENQAVYTFFKVIFKLKLSQRMFSLIWNSHPTSDFVERQVRIRDNARLWR